MNKDEIDALERRVREEYEKKLEAIRIVQGMLSSNDSRPPIISQSPEKAEESWNNEENVIDGTLIGNIEEIFKEDISKGWTAPKIEKRLREKGMVLAAKNPAVSIGQAIKKLVKREIIKRVKKGGGRIPHIYRAAQKEEAGNEA
jgi:hypothetical protein